MTERTFDTTTSESVTNALVDAIAEHRGIDELHPDFTLYDDVDVSAIDQLIRDSPVDLRLQFRLDDAIIRLQQDTEEEFRITVGRSNREVLSK